MLDQPGVHHLGLVGGMAVADEDDLAFIALVAHQAVQEVDEDRRGEASLEDLEAQDAGVRDGMDEVDAEARAGLFDDRGLALGVERAPPADVARAQPHLVFPHDDGVLLLAPPRRGGVPPPGVARRRPLSVSPLEAAFWLLALRRRAGYSSSSQRARATGSCS